MCRKLTRVQLYKVSIPETDRKNRRKSSTNIPRIGILVIYCEKVKICEKPGFWYSIYILSRFWTEMILSWSYCSFLNMAVVWVPTSNPRIRILVIQCEKYPKNSRKNLDSSTYFLTYPLICVTVCKKSSNYSCICVIFREISTLNNLLTYLDLLFTDFVHFPPLNI